MGGKKKTKQTDKTIMPEYVRRGNETLVNRGIDIANREYTPYTGDRVAGLSENEQMASRLAREGMGQGTKYISQGADALGRLTTFDQANIGAYMNPYIENVVRNQQRGVNEAFERNAADLKRTGGMRSAFGGGRQTALEGDLSENYLQQTGDLWDAGYSRAFDNAGQMWGRDMDRTIAEAGAYGDLASRQGQSTASDIRNLAATGLVERGVDQAQKDFDYGQFIESRDWDVTNMEPLLRAMQVAPGAADITKTSTTETKDSKLGQALGLATSVAGFMATGGMSSLMQMGTQALSAFGGLSTAAQRAGTAADPWSLDM